MTMSKSSIEVVTGVQKRRRWSPIEKKTLVDETYEPGKTLSYVARRHGIQPSQLFDLRRMMENGALTGVDKEEAVVPVSEAKELQQRIRQLERILGQKTVELEILKEAVRIGREKKLISRQPLLGVENFE